MMYLVLLLLNACNVSVRGISATLCVLELREKDRFPLKKRSDFDVMSNYTLIAW